MHYSTDYVFGGDAEDEVAYPDGYPEDAPIDPVNVYGESKAEGEKAIREQMEDYLILRVSWLCGARGKNFVKTMLKLADTRSEVSVVSDQVGSPAFTMDVVMKSMKLLENGCRVVAEGANMPSTAEAVEQFLKAGILYAPGKAANAGGVAVSGLEQSQNALRISWSRDEVDQRLQTIMRSIHDQCVRWGGGENAHVNYVKGANLAGFSKVAEAMCAYGVV